MVKPTAPTDGGTGKWAWHQYVHDELVDLIPESTTLADRDRLIWDAAAGAWVTSGPVEVTAGLDPKASVRAATTANVVDLAAGAPDTVDGVALAAGDRVLVKEQTAGAENGIWVVDTVGTGANGAWSRATDFDVDGEVVAGSYTFVSEGTTHAGQGWVVVSEDPITVGTDPIVWTLYIGTAAHEHAYVDEPAGIDTSTGLVAGDGVGGVELVGRDTFEPAQVEEGFRAYRSTNQTLSAATFTTIIFDTEDRDDGADYNPATGEWTVPATGWYDLGSGANFLTMADGERAILRVMNGATEAARLVDTSAAAAGSLVVSGGEPLYFSAADVVTVQAWRANAGDILGSAAQTRFTAKRRY